MTHIYTQIKLDSRLRPVLSKTDVGKLDTLFPQFGLHLKILPVPFLFLGQCVFLSLDQCILERSKNLVPHDSNVKRLLLLAWRSAWVVD